MSTLEFIELMGVVVRNPIRALLGLVLAAVVLAPGQALAAGDPGVSPPDTTKAGVTPQHVIECLHTSGSPSIVSGTFVYGAVYWTCIGGSPDIMVTCGRIDVYAFGEWNSVSVERCTSSTVAVGNISMVGNCLPGSFKYRVHYTADVFHDYWSGGAANGPQKTLTC